MNVGFAMGQGPSVGFLAQRNDQVEHRMSHDTPAALHLETVGDRRYRVENHGDATVNNVVFGGQLLAQMITVAAAQDHDQHVKTINAVFARAARVDAQTEIAVECIHAGRTFASYTITAWQGERLCARSLVLTTIDEPDLIEHRPQMPSVPTPDVAGALRDGMLVFPGAEYLIVGDIDVNDASLPSRPAQLDMWYRSEGTPDDRTIDQAALAWATDGFLIGTAMLPHAGVGQEQAHVSLSTGVVDHTLTFHRPFSLRDWVLLSHESTFAGGGRSHGRCQVFAADGALIASYVQDAMIRSMPDGAHNRRL